MIPLMNANMDVIFRTKIPIAIQGRVYAARNALQFFTIPLGYFAGGILVDYIFEPFMEGQVYSSMIGRLFGTGKGSGAALLYFILGIAGVIICLYFRRNKHFWSLEKE